MSVYRMNGMEKNGEEHMCVKDRIIKRAEDTAFVIVEICVLTCGISPSFWKSSLNRSVTMYIPGERISVWATYCGFKNCSGRCARQSEIPWWFQEVHTAAVRYSKHDIKGEVHAWRARWESGCELVIGGGWHPRDWISITGIILKGLQSGCWIQAEKKRPSVWGLNGVCFLAGQKCLCVCVSVSTWFIRSETI